MPGRAYPEARRAALIFALVIAFLPTRQAQEMEETELSADIPTDMGSSDGEATVPSIFAAVTTEIFTVSMSPTLINEDAGQLQFILMGLIPVILLAVLLFSVILFLIYRKRKRNKQEPSSRGSQSALQTNDLGSENMKLPIFEEDTPSVMEIEMEELDKWMNSMNRNANYECLPTLEEEKEPNHSNPSDNES
ncbi:transmembrane protein 154 isoform X1 [Neophocaena asiaeorientalis asiaeorientalis]|uniref:Transmembrane protein 154 isoform X1 n=1 Tax=Neophocaena asiaeorientalis asiaeorientalis TaxID=1706337 RepID=A0A341CF49_NEOAA|nr:transmembrane protein 154 isoform X1 [Neophocaena asiaeorientalis asiaeorientalis]